jgi:hypothetical protein
MRKALYAAEQAAQNSWRGTVGFAIIGCSILIFGSGLSQSLLPHRQLGPALSGAFLLSGAIQ